MYALDAAKERNTINDFEKVYDKTLKRSKDKTSMCYYDFLKNAQQSLSTASSTAAQEDDVIECDDVLNKFVSDIDPITKKSLVNPVIIKNADITTKRIAILEAIKVNRKLRCPVTGCGNKNLVIPADLHEDPTFAQLLRNHRSDDSG